MKKQANALIKSSQEVLVHCPNDIRLQGFYSSHRGKRRDLVIMIHGWEGSNDSMYLLSAAGTLFQEGFDIFRLNLRDHGTSHHLNIEPFHSCMLDEVMDAIKEIQIKYGRNQKIFLCGFSLGGNFSLRVAVNAPEKNIRLSRVVAICPVLHPPNTMDTLENGLFVYRRYFIRKWKKSLLKKKACFPEHFVFDNPEMFHSLTSMTDYLVDRYTPYPNMNTYLNGYAVTGNVLQDLTIPTHIISSRDDPVIPFKDMDRVAKPPCLEITATEYGGHCGFLQGFTMKSWINEKLVELFSM